MNISGMNIMTRCCAGSMPAFGVIHCCHSIVAPMITGVM